MKKTRSSKLRTGCIVIMICVVALGLFIPTGLGTPSSFGIGDISIICPLGSLATMLAAKMVVPRNVVALIIAMLLIVVFGRVFCSWFCPAALMRRKSDKDEKSPEDAAAADTALAPELHSRRFLKINVDRYVLGGALLSTFIFGFPVFCVVCPVGLTFATVIAVVRLFQFNDVTFSLIIFPLILVVEFVLMRRWCKSLCPLGALISLLSKTNKTFQPHVDTTVCLKANGHECGQCEKVCEWHLDPAQAPLPDCTKCRDCADNCPVSAITFPFIAPRATKEKEEK